MKGPEKIIVSIPTFQLKDQVFIHKESLLKWLNGKMTVEGATEGIVGGYDLAVKDLIEHIESI